MRAMTWSLTTLSLKSTSTSVTWPDTWLPTVTVEIALSVPVAEMATRMLPRSTVVVRQAPSSAVAVRDFQYHAASTASAITTTATSRRRVGREEVRSEEHTSELQSLMRITYAVFGLKKKKYNE